VIVIDTGVAYAAADRDDPDHTPCARLLEDHAGELLIPDARCCGDRVADFGQAWADRRGWFSAFDDRRRVAAGRSGSERLGAGHRAGRPVLRPKPRPRRRECRRRCRTFGDHFLGHDQPPRLPGRSSSPYGCIRASSVRGGRPRCGGANQAHNAAGCVRRAQVTPGQALGRATILRCTTLLGLPHFRKGGSTR
jgi:hypothetical protein